MNEGAEKPPQHPTCHAPQEVLQSPRLEDYRWTDGVSGVMHIDPLLQGKQASEQSKSSDKDDGMHQHRLAARLAGPFACKRVSVGLLLGRHELPLQFSGSCE